MSFDVFLFVIVSATSIAGGVTLVLVETSVSSHQSDGVCLVSMNTCQAVMPRFLCMLSAASC